MLPIDTTGSMGGVINDVKANVAQLIATVRTGGGIVRVEIVAYRDTDDEYVVRSFPLTTIDAARAPNARARAGRLCAIGVSRHDRMAVIRRIRHTPALSFGPSEWLAADALDETYFRLLPRDKATVTAEEAIILAAVFAEDSELPASPGGRFDMEQ